MNATAKETKPAWYRVYFIPAKEVQEVSIFQKKNPNFKIV